MCADFFTAISLLSAAVLFHLKTISSFMILEFTASSVPVSVSDGACVSWKLRGDVTISREKERESTFGLSALKPNQSNHSSESERKKHPGELKKIRSKNKKIV